MPGAWASGTLFSNVFTGGKKKKSQLLSLEGTELGDATHAPGLPGDGCGCLHLAWPAQICPSPVLSSPLSPWVLLEPLLNHFHPNSWLRSASGKTQPKSQAPFNTLHQRTCVHHHTQAQGIPRSTRRSAGYTKSLHSRRGGTEPPGTKVRMTAVSLKCPGDKLSGSLFQIRW